jgi:regulator of replication initiation timing
MKRKFTTLLLLVVFGLSGSLQAQSKKEQIEILKTRVDSLNTVNSELNIEIKNLSESMIEKNNIINANKDKIASQSEELKKRNDKINELMTSNNGLQQTVLMLKDSIDSYKLLIANLSMNTKRTDEVTWTVKLVSAECGDFCYYDFKDASTGKNITFSWNEEWDEQTGSTYPGIDSESAKIISLIIDCANYTESACSKVLNKTFVVKAVKKTREEVIFTGPETLEKTGKIEDYYEITNIRYK